MTTKSILDRSKKEMQKRKYSQNTITSYIFYIKKYLDFLNVQKSKAKPNSIEYFLKNQIQNKVSPQTYNLILNALKFFTSKVEKQTNKINNNYRKIPTKKPNILTKMQVEKIISCTHYRKHLLIFSIAYGSGLKLNEIKNLKVKDLNLDNLTIKICNKQGRLLRESILAKKLKDELKLFIADKKSTDLLFTNHKGSILSDRAIQSAFARAIIKAKITKPVTFQSLRQSFTRHLLENGTSVHIIQLLLGHKNIRTTKLYQKNSNISLQKISSPL